MVFCRELFDFVRRQCFAAILPIKLYERRRERGPARPERQLHDLFISVLNCIGERFFDHRFQKHGRPMLVEQGELRIDVGLDRKLMEDARTKTVNRRDTSAFQRALVTQPAPAFVSVCLFEEIVNLSTHTLAHFIGGAVRESNRDDIID